jgi:hypothetical protein
MSLDWGTFFGGVGKLLDKIPLQGRKERWKNELETITKEKATLLHGAADAKKAKRVIAIESRIEYLNQLLKNSATD